uniref:Glyoxysomal processing protease, glyoxysomal n=1 Tax=Chara braunii TaxID=69332 RepID=A0A388M627_CHABU
MLKVGLQGGAIDKDIIEVNHDTDFEEVAEDVVHGGLEYGGGVGESEGHHEELVVPKARTECGFVGVLLADADLVEATAEVNFVDEVMRGFDWEGTVDDSVTAGVGVLVTKVEVVVDEGGGVDDVLAERAVDVEDGVIGVDVEVEDGERVVAPEVGGGMWCVTAGVVSNMWPPCLSSGSAAVGPSLLMLDMRCLPGMEGGAVVDEDANFVGMLDRPVRPRFGSAEVQLVLTADAIFPAVRPFASAVMGAVDLPAATQQLNPASWSSANTEQPRELGEGLRPRESPREPNQRWHQRGEAPPKQGTSSIGTRSQDVSGSASLHHNPSHPKAITGHGSSHVFHSTISSFQGRDFSVEPRATVPVAEAASTSIVLVTAGEGSWASGIVLNSQGLILTNAHLLEPWRFGHEKKGRRKSTRDTSFWMNSNETSAHHHTCVDPSSSGDRQHVSKKHVSTFTSGAASGNDDERSGNRLFLHIQDDPPSVAPSSLPSPTGGQFGGPSDTAMPVSLPSPQPVSADCPVSSGASLSELVPEPLSCLGTNTSSAGSSYVKVMVRVDHPQPTMWHRAEVVYVSQGPLDVALLQLMPLPTRRLQGIGVEMHPPAVGSTAIVIGHGLFGPHSDLQASVSEGVVAKLVTVPQSDRLLAYTMKHSQMDQVPAMLQTTAAVHSGGSGGAVVDGSGKMIGLVTSNARHSGGSVLPHLNFSVPTALLARIFHFADSGGSDHSILAEMDAPNQELAAVWSLMSPPTQAEDPSTVWLPVPLPWKLFTPPRPRQGAADGQETESSSGTVQPGKGDDSDERASAVTTNQGQREGSGGEHRLGSKKGSKFAKFLADAGTGLFVPQQGPAGRGNLIRDRDRLHDSRDRNKNREETQESTPPCSEERTGPAQRSRNEIQHGGHASNRDAFRRSRL